MGGEIKFRCFEIYQRIRFDKASASFVYSPSIFEPCTMQKSLAHPQPQSYNADNQKHEKTLPFPVGAKHRKRMGSVSDHRTYHTHPRNTRKPRVQRVPKRKWMGAEKVRRLPRLSGRFLHRPSGPRGRRFKSCHSDQKTPSTLCRRCFLFCVILLNLRPLALKSAALWPSECQLWGP